MKNEKKNFQIFIKYYNMNNMKNMNNSMNNIIINLNNIFIIYTQWCHGDGGMTSVRGPVACSLIQPLKEPNP